MSKKQSASWRIVLRSLTNNNFPSSLSATDGQASFSLPHSETKFLLLGFGGKFFFGKEKPKKQFASWRIVFLTLKFNFNII